MTYTEIYSEDGKMLVKPIVMFTLRTSFDGYAQAFAKHQGPTQWQNLEDAMYALQFATQRNEFELRELTQTWAVTDFPSQFAKLARTRLH